MEYGNSSVKKTWSISDGNEKCADSLPNPLRLSGRRWRRTRTHGPYRSVTLPSRVTAYCRSREGENLSFFYRSSIRSGMTKDARVEKWRLNQLRVFILITGTCSHRMFQQEFRYYFPRDSLVGLKYAPPSQGRHILFSFLAHFRLS